MSNPVTQKDGSGAGSPDWRQRVFDAMLWVAVGLGALVYIPSVLLAAREGLRAMVTVDTFAMVAVIALALARSLSFRMRGGLFLTVLYLLAASLMVWIGSVSQVYLTGFCLVATLLFGGRVGFASVGVAALTMLGIGWVDLPAPDLALAEWASPFIGWAVITANFFLVTALLVTALHMVIASLESALRGEHDALVLLQREQAVLEASHAALEAEIDDRARAEDALAKSEARFRELAEHVQDGFYIRDVTDWRFLYASPAFERIWGRDLDALQGASEDVLATVAPADRAALRHARERLLAGEAVEVEYQVVRPDATVAWVQDSAYPVRDDPSDGAVARVVGAVRDITEHRRATERHAQLVQQLQQAQKMDAIGRLAGGVAHDFNNMLSVILGHASLVAESLAPDDPARADLNEVIAAAARSAELVGQLLAFARKQTASPKFVDLNERVRTTLKMLRRVIPEDITLDWRPGEGLPPLHLDPVQLDQILTNLVINAREAITGAGVIAIDTALTERDPERDPDLADGRYGVLTVRDDGCGMDAEVLEHLFEPFFTTRAIGSGTGLGLATVYGIVRQNRGTIHVHSAPGEGSTFRVLLPVREDAVAQVPRAQREPALVGGGETLLVVEDEPAMLRMSQRYLTRLGYTVLATSSPIDALQIAAAHDGPIDLLITDVVMPELDGKTLRDRMHQVRPATRTLFVSGYTADIISDRGVVDSGIHFLQKPFTAPALSDKIRAVLASDGPAEPPAPADADSH